MIGNDDIVALVRAAMPDARVTVFDRTGTMDHFNIGVCSAAFRGKPLMEQHRMVYRALKPAHDDGRIHAMELNTTTPENDHA